MAEKNSGSCYTVFIYDRMMETIFTDYQQVNALFAEQTPTPLKTIDVLAHGKDALVAANIEIGVSAG